MTQRKTRRKTPRKAKRPIGWLWWTAGLLSLGWVAFDANRAAIVAHAPILARMIEEPQSRVASLAASPAPGRAARTSAERPQIQAAERPTTTGAPVPPARIAAVSRSPAPADIVPTGRPATGGRSAAAPAGIVTGRRTPLLREPSAEAPVWITLEAGRPVRVTAKKGEWRRVESGIFTGWVNAAFLQTERRDNAMPVRSASSEARRGQPVPPGAIPVLPR